MYGSQAQGATARNLAQPQAQLESQSQDFFRFSHGQSPCWQDLISMFETGSDRHVSVQRHPAGLVENVPAIVNAIPGWRAKCSPSRRNRVHHPPGTLFGIIPESCSASSRKWRSPCIGFPNLGHRVDAGGNWACRSGR
jgi:hypothetical protein